LQPVDSAISGYLGHLCRYEGRHCFLKKVGLRVSYLREDFHLGIGEAEALSLAIEQQADLVATDDRNAIRACKLLRLRFTTAIGVLIRLQESGRLTAAEARRGLDRLAVYGRYHRTILEDAKRRLEGEEYEQGPENPEHPC
jgi:predicted nucleic acid-binding protein